MFERGKYPAVMEFGIWTLNLVEYKEWCSAASGVKRESKVNGKMDGFSLMLLFLFRKCHTSGVVPHMLEVTLSFSL